MDVRMVSQTKNSRLLLISSHESMNTVMGRSTVLKIIRKCLVLVSFYHSDRMERTAREIYLALWNSFIYATFKVLVEVSRTGEMTGIHKVSAMKPERKRQLGRLRQSWVDILRWIFKKWNVGVWTG